MYEEFRGVRALLKNSFIDYPGTASAVLFYGGCNLRCPYCHNSSLLEPGDVDSGFYEELWSFLLRRRSLLDGVVITGGEPTLHSSLPALLELLKVEFGYRVKLDSNGGRPDVLRSLGWDYLALDVKTLPEHYEKRLSAPPAFKVALEESIDLLRSVGDRGEARITLAPGVLEQEDLEGIVDLLRGVKRVALQPFSSRGDILDRYFFSGRSGLTESDISWFEGELIRGGATILRK